MRRPNQAFISGVCNLAQDLGCDFLGDGNMLYEGSAVGVAVGLRNSPALRFVADPMTFLENVRDTDHIDDR